MDPMLRNQEFINSILADVEKPDGDATRAMIVWDQLKTEAAFYAANEMALRKALFKRFFPQPREGVNNYPLASGYVLKGTPKVNVRVDEAVIPNVRTQMASMGLALDPFLKVKHDLVWSAYKQVRDDEEANKTVGPVLRTMLTFTEGAPVLDIHLPAKAAKAQNAS